MWFQHALKRFHLSLWWHGSKKIRLAKPRKLPDPSILTIAIDETDLTSILRMAHRLSWPIRSSSSVTHALTLLEREKFSIIFCNHDLVGRDWHDVLPVLASDETSPIIVLVSPVADANLWAEVIRRGGYDVVTSPIDELRLLHTLNMGWSYWRNRPTAQSVKSNGVSKSNA